jgi:hypothetical protein
VISRRVLFSFEVLAKEVNRMALSLLSYWFGQRYKDGVAEENIVFF